MQVRTEIEVIPADEKETEEDAIVITPRNEVKQNNGLRLGWTVTETIGIGIVNPRAIAKLSKKAKVGE